MQTLTGTDFKSFKKTYEAENVNKAFNNNAVILPAKLIKTKIDSKSKIDPITPVIKIQDSHFSVRGEISLISGLPKVGKTAVCTYMIATAFMKEIPSDFDCLGIKTEYCNGKDVIYIDTEQPESKTNDLRKLVYNILDIKEDPPNLHFSNLREYDSKTKKELVFEWIRCRPNAHLIIVDGVADLIQDPNNTEQAFGIIESLMQRSKRTTLVLHLHENPSGGKMRGNLGSEAERKCGGAITIKKEKGIHSIHPRQLRYSQDFEPIYFQYSKIEKRMVSVDAELIAALKKETDPEEIKLERRSQMAERITLQGITTLSHKDAISAIMTHSSSIEGKEVKERTAENRLKEMVKMNLLQKDDLGKYTLIK